MDKNAHRFGAPCHFSKTMAVVPKPLQWREQGQGNAGTARLMHVSVIFLQ